MPEVEQFQRLSTVVCPKNYRLTLQPNLTKCIFKGSVEIEIEIKSPVERITMNCVDLVINDASVIQNGATYTASNTELTPTKELLTIFFTNPLQPIGSVLKINFEGILSDKLRGFYRSKYHVGTEERYAAVSQFEATDARRCFPCWDEPAIKATYDITLIAPSDRIALSNMHEIAKDPHPEDPSLNIVKFATTPIMSTYLVAVIVGEYDYVEKTIGNGVKIRVYTPLGKKEQGEFALEVASKVVPYFEDYFQIRFPLTKLDLIAIADFSIGAMENWGLITYRETCLLVDPHNTSTRQKQNIALTVGHEIAHQWFGNLVTMEWWTHLWLNEGYATFGEFLCIEHLFPEYDIWAQFVTDTFICALELDALKNSHPIEVPVGHPSEIEEIFDSIAYNKGASVIRMIHAYIGDKKFRKGMNLYLNRHKFSNAKTEDLWRALAEASGKPVDAMMSTWTKQTGFPFISIVSQQDGNSRVLTLTQKRFLADGSTDQNSEWMVPISFMTANHLTKPLKEFLLDATRGQVILEGVSAHDWVKLNLGTVGYFRTKYPSEMLSQLLPAITSKTLPPLDRLGIVDDLFALVQAGHCSTIEVLRLLKAYEDETDFTVWSAICNCLGQLNQLLSNTSFHKLFTNFARKLLAKIGTKVGWEARPGESHQQSLLRMLVLDRLGLYGDESVIAEAKSRLAAHLSGTTQLPADLRSPVYRSVLRQNCPNTFQQMIQLYRETELHEEKNRILVSLGTASDPNLIQKTLEFSMSEDVRLQDTIFGINSVASSVLGRMAAWNFFKKHIDVFITRFQGLSLLLRLIEGITQNFASEDMALEVETFFKEMKPIEATERTIRQSVECIRLNSAWLGRDSDKIEKYLADQI